MQLHIHVRAIASTCTCNAVRRTKNGNPWNFVAEGTGGSEHLADASDACDEGIDVVPRVVEGEAGTAGAFDAEAVHEGLGTMVTCAHGYAEAVEECTQVKVVDIAHEETDDSIVGRAEEAHPRNL